MLLSVKVLKWICSLWFGCNCSYNRSNTSCVLSLNVLRLIFYVFNLLRNSSNVTGYVISSELCIWPIERPLNVGSRYFEWYLVWSVNVMALMDYDSFTFTSSTIIQYDNPPTQFEIWIIFLLYFVVSSWVWVLRFLASYNVWKQLLLKSSEPSIY